MVCQNYIDINNPETLKYSILGVYKDSEGKEYAVIDIAEFKDEANEIAIIYKEMYANTDITQINSLSSFLMNGLTKIKNPNMSQKYKYNLVRNKILGFQLK